MSEEKESPLNLILEKIGPGKTPENYQLWVCRGAGRGCDRNKYRRSLIHCDDCYLPDEADTIEEVVKKLARGDA